MPKIDRGAHICVIGAGAAGIATAYELRKHGYEHVTVFEKSTRVGGLCLSEGFQGRAFDMGANYVTSGYREVRRLAAELGAPLYTETRGRFFDRGTQGWTTIFATARGDAGTFAFGAACLRYLWLRWRLGRVLPPVGYDGVSRHPALMRSFEDWLGDNHLLAIRKLCSIPVTLMGYGRLADIPAPYVLTYLQPRTFFDLLMYGSGLPRRWPKRFDDGFQRLFERMAWRLDVRLSTTVTGVRRDEHGVTVTYFRPVDEGWLRHRDILTDPASSAADGEWSQRFDHVVVACPLQDTAPFLDTSDVERAMFSQIVLNPFATTTFLAKDFDLPARVVNVVEQVDAAPSPDAPEVSIVTQQFKGNPLVTFYTPLPPRPASAGAPAGEEDDQRVLEGVERLANDLGLDLQLLFSCNHWPYFPHVEVKDMADGWYDRLEALQGTNRTFYNGGVMCFELIEPILAYSRELVRREFVGAKR